MVCGLAWAHCSQLFFEGSGAVETSFGCEPRIAWWTVCLMHVPRSYAFCDFQEWKVFTMHPRAGTCDGISCFWPPWLGLDGHRVFWSLIFCGVELPLCIYMGRCTMPVKLGWVTVLLSSEYTGRLMYQEHSVIGDRLRQEAHRGGDSGYMKAILGMWKCSRTCAEL